MRARDLMCRPLVTIPEEMPLSEVFDLFVSQNVGGAPVVDVDNRIVGVITAQDVFFGCAGTAWAGDDAGRDHPFRREIQARDVMTSPAVCATEDTEVTELAHLMSSMHLQRIPIVRGGRVSGVVSAIDLCRAISQGTITTPA